MKALRWDDGGGLFILVHDGLLLVLFIITHGGERRRDSD